MKKILFLTDSEALKNLVSKNQDYEFEFISDENAISQNSDFSALILDQVISKTDFVNSLVLPVISFCQEQKDLNNIHFLSKPLHITSLFAKIEELTEEPDKKTFRLGDCIIDLTSRFVRKDGGVEIKLTELEAKILDFFLKDPGAQKTKDRILQEVWNYRYTGQMADTGIVEVTINKLRKKLKEAGIDEAINFKIT